ncbi:hypothetical protein [Nocardioides marmoriginsengisoli]|nr:hypothetical protein [Nocardioides marmoriginsengisoli]
MNTFKDLAPTETDASGVVGGAAFLDIGPAVIALVGGILVTVFGHID